MNEQGKNIVGNGFYRSLIDNSLELLFLVDADGFIEYVTPSVSQHLGYRTHDLIGTLFADYVLPGEQKSLQRYIRNLLSINSHTRAVISFKHKDGKNIDLALYGKNLLDNPNINGLLFSARDVSAQRLIQSSLKRTQKQYNDLMSGIPQTVCEISPQGYITFVNENGSNKFGYSEDDLISGMHMRDVLAPEYHHLAVNTLREIMAGQETGPQEYVAIRRDGTRVPILVYSSAIRDETDKIIGVRAMLVDLSELRTAEDKLLDSYRHLGVVNRQLAILKDMSQCDTNREIGQVQTDILSYLCELTQGSWAIMYTVNYQKRSLVQVAHYGLEPETIGQYVKIAPEQLKYDHRQHRSLRKFDHKDLEIMPPDGTKTLFTLPLSNIGAGQTGLVLIGSRENTDMQAGDLENFLELAQGQSAALLSQL